MPASITPTSDWKPRKRLLSSKLLFAIHLAQLDDIFHSSLDPVAWLIHRGIIGNPQTFYADMAKLYHLPYMAEIPLALNPNKAELPLLRLPDMAKLQVFHLRQGDSNWLFIANPALPATQMKSLLQQLPKNTKVTITSHGQINEALTFYNAYLETPLMEKSLAFARPEHSSSLIMTQQARRVVAILAALAAGAWLIGGSKVIAFVFIAINLVYFILNPLRFLLYLAGRWINKSVTVEPEELAAIDDQSLPLYTIIVPLKQESEVIPTLVNNVRSLSYPPHLLDIKIAVEVNDRDTLAALAKMGIYYHNSSSATPENVMFHIVKVPIGSLSTKPRSCNFALNLARGSLTVIYDAEDRPDTLQLRKAWLLLLKSRLNTLCVQARLTFYNANQNLLTRFFTLEYGFWFDSFLPGLQALGIPLPLGGTSNHFLTGTLKKIGAWDPYNVTEDADLGWRLSRYHYETLVLNSFTQEEAMSNLWGWIKQRTRWQKGFFVTFLVHSRNPLALMKDLGGWRGLASLAIYGSIVSVPLINPILWVMFIGWYLLPGLGLPQVDLSGHPILALIASINLLVGNSMYILIHLFVALKQKQKYLLPLVFLMPFYWPLLSIASYRALWQLVVNPSSWEKSAHGLHL